jgi:type 1 glutamine amidotransferase
MKALLRCRRAAFSILAGVSLIFGGRLPAAENGPQLPSGSVVVPESIVTDAERQKIEDAISAKAPAVPTKPRKLLIFDLNVGYGGHPSIAYANIAFRRMGRKTAAFDTVVSHDPASFKRENLKQFDAVLFNNTVGNPFDDRALRESLLDFVRRGGGLAGIHGATVSFMKWPEGRETWPEFGKLIGGRGANHREQNERIVVKLDDPTHPINRVFGGKGFEYTGEFFRVGDPYSRDSVRVLLSIDTQRTNLDRPPYRGRQERADGDYALAWVRGYGQGRVFYCTIAHNPEVFWDPTMLKFYLAATQFVLGDLPAATAPSGKTAPDGSSK